MDIIISSNNNERIFSGKNVITIGTNSGCNFQLDLDYEVLITIQFDFSIQNYINLGFKEDNKIGKNIIKKEGVLYKRGIEDFEYNAKIFVIRNKNVLFRSEPLRRLELGSINRIAFKNSNQILNIKLLQKIPA